MWIKLDGFIATERIPASYFRDNVCLLSILISGTMVYCGFCSGWHLMDCFMLLSKRKPGGKPGLWWYLNLWGICWKASRATRIDSTYLMTDMFWAGKSGCILPNYFPFFRFYIVDMMSMCLFLLSARRNSWLGNWFFVFSHRLSWF